MYLEYAINGDGHMSLDQISPCTYGTVHIKNEVNGLWLTSVIDLKSIATFNLGTSEILTVTNKHTAFCPK